MADRIDLREYPPPHISKEQVGPWLAGYASACRVLRRLVVSQLGVTKRSTGIRNEILAQYRLVLRWCEMKWGDDVAAVDNQKESDNGTDGNTTEQ